MTFDLAQAFLHKQQQLEHDLRTTGAVSHPTDKGDIGEESWRTLLRDLLPQRYGVSKATVVDATGGSSDAIDIVVHDKHFSPLVFKQYDVLYVPAESVYAVFEVKPELDKAYIEYAAKKAQSVRVLHRTSAVVVHAGGTVCSEDDQEVLM